MRRKVLLPLVVLSLSASAYAEESMSSLSYRVKGKEFHYDLGMNFGTPKFNTTKVDSSLSGSSATSSTEHKSYENSQTTWTNEFSYGVSDAFSFGVGLDFDLKNSLTQKSSVTGSTANSATSWSSAERKNAGLESIDLNTSYRFMDGETKADFLFGLKISGKGEVASQKYNSAGTAVVGVSEGNAKKGGSEIQLGTQFSGKMSAMEWASVVGLNYKLKKKFTNVSGDLTSTGSLVDYDSETKANLDFMLGFAGQYNLNSSMSFGADLTALFAAKEESTSSAYAGNATKTNISSTVKSHTDLTLDLNMKYAVMSNLLFGVNYSHMFAADLEETSSEVNGSTTTNYTGKTLDRKADMFGFSLAYKF